MAENKGITELAYMLASEEEPDNPRLSEGDIIRQMNRLEGTPTGGVTEMLTNLAHMLARKEDPSGRLSEGDIIRQMNRLKSLLGNNKENMAEGGRAGYQTGGITETRNLPPEYIEALGKTYAADLTRQAGIPSITTATTQQPGETAQQWQQRQAQAQQFGITKAGMADLAPTVAAQDPYQAAAYAQAVDPTTGLGAYQPYLTAAGTAATTAGGLTGPMTGAQLATIDPTTGQTVTPTLAPGSYMSPYQQQVIDASLADYDAQAAKSRLALGAPQLAGVFGGGRHGIAEAEFDVLSNRGRGTLQSGLRQRGFEQAQQARQQDLANQMGLANYRQV